MFSQIEKGNIDLNPKFQRRNAWSDEKRCRLIESLITGMPVPEIVLAENPSKPKSYLVIDGKQRLMTIAGFMKPAKYQAWSRPILQKMAYRPELDGSSYEDIEKKVQFEEQFRSYVNADVRCTVLSNIDSTEILYDIFYRLNSGSVPLSAQELRQVLHPGPFADYLITCTNDPNPIQMVLGLDGPDDRLVDAELLLRMLAFRFFPSSYSGNLNVFLETAMETVTTEWASKETDVREQTKLIFNCIEYVHSLIPGKVGRKFIAGKWQKRFNKSIFEVEIISFLATQGKVGEIDPLKFISALENLFTGGSGFTRSVEATTKSLENYRTRFSAFQEMLSDLVGTQIHLIPGE